MAAQKLAYQANCWGPLGGNAVGVTSIARLTYRTFGDMEQAIAEIGGPATRASNSSMATCSTCEAAFISVRALLAEAGSEARRRLYSGGNFIFADILGEELARIDAGGARPRGARRGASGGRRRRQTPGRLRDERLRRKLAGGTGKSRRASPRRAA